MLWSFIAVCLSAWLSVDASYRGPTWQRWVFKPLTLLLLLFLHFADMDSLFHPTHLLHFQYFLHCLNGKMHLLVLHYM